MNIKECREEALKHINRYSVAGTTIAPSYNNQTDYILRTTGLINDAQMEIAKTNKKIFATYRITQMAITNLLGDGCLNSFKHLNTDVVFDTSSAAKSYYFEMDGPGTVTISHNDGTGYTTLKTIEVTTTGYSAYKGLINALGATRMSFSGAYPYNFRYPCLYGNTFASDTAVAQYRPYLEYEMPIDFYQLCGRGIPQYIGGDFLLGHDYEWRGLKTLLLKRELEGEFIVDYYRFPVNITATTPDTTELDNTLDTHQAIPYFVASGLARQDDPHLAASLYNLFETRLARLIEVPQTDVSRVEDVYGFFS